MDLAWILPRYFPDFAQIFLNIAWILPRFWPGFWHGFGFNSCMFHPMWTSVLSMCYQCLDFVFKCFSLHEKIHARIHARIHATKKHHFFGGKTTAVLSQINRINFQTFFTTLIAWILPRFFRDSAQILATGSHRAP